MRSFLPVALALLVFSSFAAAGIGPADPAQFNPAVVDSGLPDAFGYTWKINSEPGGPTFAWKELAGVGTMVTGMQDDNFVGPFPIGFPFRYYWYDVTQFWIGSNGYLMFSSPFNIAQPFPQIIPQTAAPNDYLAVYIGDWYPGQNGQGHVYRWNNADSCVVAWDSIPAWVVSGNGGRHDFEVILSRLDSSITFQYGMQTGLVSNNDILVGIENVSGQVGLLVGADIYRTTSTAVKFYYPPSTTYQAHDLAAYQVGDSTSTGLFVLQDSVYTPFAQVKNVGNQNETSFTARFRIFQGNIGGNVVYNQLITGGPINANQQQNLNFEQSWTPTTPGQYVMTLSIDLAGDQNPSNNNKATECRVLVLPGTLLYDDGTPEQGWSWQGGNGGLGTRFVPPTYPVRIDCLFYYLTLTSSPPPFAPFSAQILSDSGPGGMPGAVLYQQNVTATTPGVWYGLNIASQNVVINSGAFYVAWIQTDSTSLPVGVDTSGTQIGSRQTYEFAGGWAPFRNSEFSDFLIRARVTPVTTGVLPEETHAPISYALAEAHPNPFNSTTTISYSLPAAGDVTLTVYDQAGRLISRLVSGWRAAGTHTAMFDGRDLASGVYLVRLQAGAYTATRKVVMLK